MGSTLIVGAIFLFILFFSGKRALKDLKSGKCAGCSGCGSGSSCNTKSQPCDIKIL